MTRPQIPESQRMTPEELRASPVMLETAAEALVGAVGQLVAAAVAAALAAHCCGTGETAAAPPPALLTYTQACQQLGVSRSTLYKLLREGDLRNVALAPQVRRIPAAELDRYLASLRSDGQ